MTTTPTPSVLVIDDDAHLRKFIARGLSRVGLSTVATDSGSSGIALLRNRKFHAVLCDLHMPEVDGLDVLRFAGTLNPPPPFIMLTGYGSVSVAVEAMKHGAADFLEKPASIDELKAAIQAVINRNKPAEEKETRPHRPSKFVGSPRWLDPFLQSLHRIAQTDATVLIEGETGTGKSAVAREIWRASKRAKGPFVEINCAAIPDHLLESELFGHVRGAFTGATSSHVGKVEQANAGTLFLDEVGELKHELQAKLLHLLQERTFSPVGGRGQRQADVRFVAATNRDLLTEVNRGHFREDLFYRLNVVNLTIPPLRERKDDIPLLVEQFRKTISGRMAENVPEFSEPAIDTLTRYNWPGNIRELENLVERMSIMHPPGTVIEPSLFGERIREATVLPDEPDMAPQIRSGRPDPTSSGISFPPTELEGRSLSEAVKSYESHLLSHALDRAGGNKSKAAKMLNMKRTTLIEKLKKLGITSHK